MRIHITIAFLAILLISCDKQEEKKIKVEKGFSISDTMMKSTTVADVTDEYIKDEMGFFGKIAADKNQYIDIYPLVGGNVLSVNAELGDYVHKGQVLATIRSSEIAGFQRDLSNAKTEIIVAKNNLRVARELNNSRLNTDKDVVEAKSQVQKAQEELTRTQAINKIYNIRGGNIYTVTAPISGYIVQKNINKDMQLRSDRTDNIFDVANTKNVWAIVNVNQEDIDKISVGMRADVTTLIDPDKVYHGTINKIFKIIDPSTNAMQARVDLDNTNGELVPESKATIKIFNTESTVGLSIPKESLIFDDNRYFVVVFKNRNDLKIREVRVLKQTGDRAYIAEGLEKGEKVLTSNQLMVYRALNM